MVWAMSRKKKNTRPLTAGEVALAKSVFGDAINYDAVRIKKKRVLMQPRDGAICLGNTINMDGNAYSDDYACEDLNVRAFFIHEMTHIWQYQRNPLGLGIKFMREAIRHRQHYLDRAYHYDLDPIKPFSKYGLEQQATMMQDFYILSRIRKDAKYDGRCTSIHLCMDERRKRMMQTLAPVFWNPKTRKRAKPTKRGPKA